MNHCPLNQKGELLPSMMAMCHLDKKQYMNCMWNHKNLLGCKLMEHLNKNRKEQHYLRHRKAYWNTPRLQNLQYHHYRSKHDSKPKCQGLILFDLNILYLNFLKQPNMQLGLRIHKHLYIKLFQA